MCFDTFTCRIRQWFNQYAFRADLIAPTASMLCLRHWVSMTRTKNFRTKVLHFIPNSVQIHTFYVWIMSYSSSVHLFFSDSSVFSSSVSSHISLCVLGFPALRNTLGFSLLPYAKCYRIFPSVINWHDVNMVPKVMRPIQSGSSVS